ncbi:hypothetical protein [Microlunatus sp. GCM10028923]|uniref:hypothetical protein n=1 Tax=Microlunatus sp. GCM10028923 TaxID=3273400 RepID=UPI003620499A
MLQPLGIRAEAEAIYVVLATTDAASVEELAQRAGAPLDSAEHSLSELRGLGLAAEVTPGLWKALPLLDVVSGLRAQRLSELETATIAAESLASHLLAASESTTDAIKVLVGTDAIVAAHREIWDSAKREVCAFDKPPYVKARPNATPESLLQVAPEWRALERGVGIRAVYHPGFDSDRLAELALFGQRGEQSRTAPVPMKLVVVDGQVAMIPSMRSYGPGHELRVSVTRHPAIIEMLQWLFESVWDSSVPIITHYGRTDPRRQMLISLLMTGSTDNAIAGQLGVTVRSVRRWISDLMDELGVTTRLQLGAALVRADALNQTPDRQRA